MPWPLIASTGTGSGAAAEERLSLSLREQLSESLMSAVHLETSNSSDKPKRLKFAVQVLA